MRRAGVGTRRARKPTVETPAKKRRKRRTKAEIAATTRVRMECAYGPDGKAICPRCFSLPDVEVRHRRDIETREKGWGLTMTEKTVVVSGIEHKVAKMKYPCSNHICLTDIVVRWAFGCIGPEAKAPFLFKQALSEEDAERYLKGSHGQDGIWKDGGVVLLKVLPETTPAPAKSTSAAVHMETRGPWALIHAPGFMDKIPKHWKIEDGKIKTRAGTEAHDKIVKWFKKKGVKLAS